MQIVWTQRTARTYENAIDYIAERNPAAALQQDSAVMNQTSRLVDLPHLGAVLPDGETRMLVIAGTPYIVAYRLKGARIEIFRFIHTARKRAAR